MVGCVNFGMGSERDLGHELLLRQVDAQIGRLLMVGEVRKELGYMTKYRYLGSYAIVVLVDGEGTYEDERGMVKEVRRGDAMLVLPDIGHRYGVKEMGGKRSGFWHELYVVFDGDIFDLWRAKGLLDPSRCLFSVDDVEGLVSRLRAMCQNIEAGALSTVVEFQSILAELIQGVGSEEEGPHLPSWMAQATSLLTQTNLTPLEVAEKVGMGYEHFRKEFKRHMAISPGKYRGQQRLQQAWHILVGSNAPIKEIACDLGFCDEHYFSRFFKQHMGVSPKQCRDQYKG